MSAEEKAIVRRFIEEVFNGGNLGTIDEFVSPDMIDHTDSAGRLPWGPESVKHALTLFRTAFPDWYTEIEDMIAKGNKVMFQGTSSGTHRGEFMGALPSGRRVAVNGVHIMRLSGGKIVEHWAFSDQVGMTRQLGMIQTPGQTGS